MNLNYDSGGNGNTIIPKNVGRGSTLLKPTFYARKFCDWQRGQFLLFLMVFSLLGNITNVSAQVNLYGFSAGTDGVLQDMTGSTQLIGASSDDGVSAVTNIGFTFNYAGTDRIQFSVNSNGLMRLGSTAAVTGAANYTNSAANANSNTPAIMPYWDDLHTGVGGKVHYLLTGTTPNQRLVVEWIVTVPRSTSGNANAKFQCWLDEGTNEIHFVYGSGMVVNNGGASIGLATATAVYNTITVSTNTNSTATFVTNNTQAIPSGTIYTFVPPALCEGIPEGGMATPDLTNVCTGAASGVRTVTGQTTGVLGLTYQWEQSTDGENYVDAVGGSGATTLSYTPPVFSGTDIYYRLKITCADSGLSGYSTASEVKGPIIPQTLPSNLNKIEYLDNTVNFSWANGNGTRRYVVINSVDEFTNPSGDDVTASSTYTTGEQIVYDGTGTSVTVSGLVPGNYFVKIYEYVRCTGTPNVNYYNVDFVPVSITIEATNGSCANAKVLDISNIAVTSQTGTTIGSSVGTDYLNCATLGTQATERGAWYKFTGNDKQVTFYTCHPTIGYDTRLSVYSGSCGDFTCIAVNDDVTPACVGANQYSSKVTFNALTGVEYYIFVHGYQSGTSLSATGNFVLTWELEDLCSPETVNDECSNAQLLTIGTSTASSNGCATQSFGVAFPSAGSALGTYFDTWYKFNSGSAANARISLTYDAPVEVGFSVYQNACGSLTQISGASNLTGGQMTINGMIPNTEYYVRVYSSQIVKRGDYTVNLFEVCSLPTSITSLVQSENEVTVSWVSSVSSTLSSYNYELRTSGAAGSGATGLVIEDTTELSTLTFDSLDPNTTYSFYIKSICSSDTDTSSWSSAISFYTGYCVPSSTSALTYIDNFSTVGAMTNISNLTSGYTTGGYQDNYDSISMSHHAGGSFLITANITGGTAGLNVWVDWNNNFVFEDNERVFISGTYVNGVTNHNVTIPEDIALGEYRMRVRTDYSATNPSACSNANTRTEAEDYKLTIVEQPEESVSWANLQSFVVGGDAVTAMQPCQTVDVYTQAWDAVATEPAGENPDLKVWIGMNTENTDPSTWPESAFTLAAYNIQDGNNDEYKVTYTTLPEGDHYFVARYKLGFGPYKYGASNNGFWNEDTNPAALLAVSIPAIEIEASQTSFCETAEEVTLTASSTNSNFTYVWSDGLGNDATATVTPTETTTYTVTGTDSETGCTNTTSVTISVNPYPSAATINFTDATMCVGSVQQLSVDGGSLENSLSSGSGTFTSQSGSATLTGPNPFQNYYGGTKQQFIYKAEELINLGFIANTEIKSISVNIVNPSGGASLNNVVVKMKNSTKSVFASTTNWETDMVTVRNAATLNPVAGQNELLLNNPFTWDGESNLVVEINYSNNDTGGSGANTAKYSATDFASTLYLRVDNATTTAVDNFNGTGTIGTVSDPAVFNSRTDIIFNVGIPGAITWSPATDLYTDAEATIPYVENEVAAVVYTKPTATVSYVATVTSSMGCAVSSVSQEFNLHPESPLPTVPGSSAGGGLSNLIISEYGEGAGGNKKYIELYNGTGADVDLANYQVWLIANGGNWPESTLNLSGTLANNTTYTIAHNSGDVIGADLYSTGVMGFNGNDAVGIAYNGGSGTTFTLLDAVGTDGDAPGSGWEVAGIANATVDKILTRKATVCSPNTDWAISAATEWDVSDFAYNNTSQTDATLGNHTANCSATGAGALEICPTATVADVLNEVTGTDLKLYEALTGGVALSETANLTEASYFVSQVVGGCESARVEIAITFSEIQTPDFAEVGTICEGSTAPLLETTSPNGIEGIWSPATVDNMVSGSYVFTPNAGICANTQTVIVTVTSTPIAPDFVTELTICSTDDVSALETTSPNGIIGTWSPATIDNEEGGVYTFTPDAGQCGSVHELTVTVITATVPDFAIVTEICSGSIAPVLDLTSPNGVTGTWSPAVIDNTETADYVFTPDAGQCAVGTTITVTVNDVVTPDFIAIDPICSGDTAPVLELTSPNGVAGTWSPAVIDNTQTADYVFTPDADQCAISQTLTVTVNSLPTLVITDPAAVCSSETVDITAAAVVAGSDADLSYSYWADPFGQVTFPDPNAISSSGTFYIKAENTTGCSVILPVVVVVNTTDAPTTTQPVQDFNGGDTLEDFDVTGDNIVWYDAETGGNVLPASTTVIVSGVIYYASQTVNGCESETRLAITAGEDLETPTFEVSKFNLYPNPVIDNVTIVDSSLIKSVEVYNMLGQRVLQKSFQASQVTLDLSQLAAGGYLVNVTLETGFKSVKIIKK